MFVDTATEMAKVLVDDDVDLEDHSAVIRALTQAGFRSSHINTFLDDAINIARESLADNEEAA